ncbi:hypothetical protein OPV22_026296 [Ensete ventricosum]|uniref:RING-CH-type domain-containing protein n=1 Tax=Ensete ventricosum TaxID=4639 RepID=A0AAV8QLH1_ENSVE|nr:hypothetical protein OPV22_026296 [Ensete ventricosum]
MEEFGNGEEIRLLVDDDDGLAFSCSPPAAATLCLCRICHEEEEERNTRMESPCGCSGTLKFAHRECIQRWCDEKGNNVCEICLEKFEPGYTIPEKKALIDVGVTIRGSLEVPRLNYDPHNPEFVADDDAASDRADCSPSSRRRASYCRSIVLLLMMILLMRNLIAVITVGADHYAFTILTVFLLRASGILLPFYLVMRFVSAFQEAHRQDQLLHMETTLPVRRSGPEEEEEEEHRIHIRF